MSSRGGVVICIEGYRFSKHRTSGFKTRWYCATHHHRGCTAVIFTIETNEIIRCKNIHNHPAIDATIYRIYLFLTDPIYTVSNQGGIIMIIDGYRYCKRVVDGPKIRWSCSSHRARKCKAFISTIENHFVKWNLDHNH
ncbi:hypothetical protein ABMA28_001429 [Loxostege sticticalis]|uniref:FLYWCH-type domain-containing protein n=1 Tax=Loxostege sticticalis TaxID=481309 RepID=A0ABD0T5S8_LOXSC